MAAVRKKKARKGKAAKKPVRKRKLSARQRAFVREYLKDFNATQAAIRAGYSEKTAKQQGARLLTNADVAAAIAVGQEKAAKRAELSVDQVLQRYWWIATLDITKVLSFSSKSVTLKSLSDIPEGARYAIASVADTKDGVKVTFHSKTDALAKIGKHLGMFVDVHLIKTEIDALLDKLKGRVTQEEYDRALEAFDAPDD